MVVGREYYDDYGKRKVRRPQMDEKKKKKDLQWPVFALEDRNDKQTI